MALKAGYVGIKKLSEQLNLTTEGTLSLNVENDPDAGGSLPISGDAAKILAERDAATRQLIDDTVGFESINLLEKKITEIAWQVNRDATWVVSGDAIVITTANSERSGVYTSFANLGVTNKPNVISFDVVASKATTLILGNDNSRVVEIGTTSKRVEYTDVDDEYITFYVTNDPCTVTISNLMIAESVYEGMPYQPYHASVDSCKADNTVIAPVEDGTTIQNPSGYAVGSHAIRNGAFITWKNAKAQGETIADSDYTSGDVASELTTETGTVTGETGITVNSSTTLRKVGRIITLNYRFEGVTVTANTTTKIASLPQGFYPSESTNGVYITLDTAKLGRILVNTSGDISVNSPEALTSEKVVGSISWIKKIS